MEDSEDVGVVQFNNAAFVCPDIRRDGVDCEEPAPITMYA